MVDFIKNQQKCGREEQFYWNTFEPQASRPSVAKTAEKEIGTKTADKSMPAKEVDTMQRVRGQNKKTRHSGLTRKYIPTINSLARASKAAAPDLSELQSQLKTKLSENDYAAICQSISLFPKEEQVEILNKINELSKNCGDVGENINFFVKVKKCEKISQILRHELGKLDERNLMFYLDKGPHFTAEAVKDIFKKQNNIAYFAGLDEAVLNTLTGEVLSDITGKEAADIQVANMVSGIKMALAARITDKVLKQNAELEKNSGTYGAALDPKILVLAPLETALVLENLGASPGDVLVNSVVEAYKEREGLDLALKLYSNLLANITTAYMNTALKSGKALVNNGKKAMAFGTTFLKNLRSGTQEKPADELSNICLKTLTDTIKGTFIPGATAVTGLLEISMQREVAENTAEINIKNELEKAQADVNLIKSVINLSSFFVSVGKEKISAKMSDKIDFTAN